MIEETPVQGLEATGSMPEQIVPPITRTPMVANTPVLRGISFAELAVTMPAIEWQWSAWLPKGVVVLLVGDPGCGKSMLALTIAGCFTDSRCWPDGTPYEGPPQRVLWIETEHAMPIQIDRATRWGINLQLIEVPPCEGTDIHVDLENPRTREVITELMEGNDYGLVVVDSLRQAFSGDENSSEFAKGMQWLASLARRTGTPVMVIHHLRKRGNVEMSTEVTLDHIRGTSALAQVARAIWAVSPGPVNTDIKRLAAVKSNLGKLPPALGVIITDDGLELLPEAPAPVKAPSSTERAEALLREIFATSQTVPANTILQAAKEQGIPEGAIQRAKERLGVTSQKVGRDSWNWVCPGRESSTSSTSSASSETLDFGL